MKQNIGHQNKSSVSCRDMAGKGLILASDFIRLKNMPAVLKRLYKPLRASQGHPGKGPYGKVEGQILLAVKGGRNTIMATKGFISNAKIG